MARLKPIAPTLTIWNHSMKNDWCHLRGRRKDHTADVWYGENAEHDEPGDKSKRYVRICDACARNIREACFKRFFMQKGVEKPVGEIRSELVDEPTVAVHLTREEVLILRACHEGYKGENGVAPLRPASITAALDHALYPVDADQMAHERSIANIVDQAWEEGQS